MIFPLRLETRDVKSRKLNVKALPSAVLICNERVERYFRGAMHIKGRVLQVARRNRAVATREKIWALYHAGFR